MANKKYICLLATVALAMGSALTLGPAAWRYAKRVVVRQQARQRWVAWCAGENHTVKDGDPAGWLRVPSCGIDNIVLAGSSKSNLEKSVCMQSLDALGGEELQVLSGHRDTHFRRLRRISPGEELSIAGADGSLSHYRVADIEVIGHARVADYLLARSRPGWVVLMTCYPFRFVGPAPKRFIVWGRPVDPV